MHDEDEAGVGGGEDAVGPDEGDDDPCGEVEEGDADNPRAVRVSEKGDRELVDIDAQNASGVA